MNKILTIIFILFIFNIKAQNNYPKQFVDSCGDTLIIVTLKQAQSIDNKLDLLKLYEEMDADIANKDSMCLLVIKEKDNTITLLKNDILLHKKNIEYKNIELDYLNKVLVEDKKVLSISNNEVKNRQEIIEIKNKEIKHIKRNMWIGGATLGSIIAILSYCLITM